MFFFFFCKNKANTSSDIRAIPSSSVTASCSKSHDLLETAPSPRSQDIDVTHKENIDHTQKDNINDKQKENSMYKLKRSNAFLGQKQYRKRLRELQDDEEDDGTILNILEGSSSGRYLVSKSKTGTQLSEKDWKTLCSIIIDRLVHDDVYVRKYTNNYSYNVKISTEN